MENELYHHGTKGMKWGIRRYQNPDGSLTKAGEKRYLKNARFKAKIDRERGQAQITKNVKEFTDSELRSSIDRMKLENEYSRLMTERLPKEPPPSKVKQLATKLVGDSADKFVTELSNALGAQASMMIKNAIFKSNKPDNKSQTNNNNQNNQNQKKKKNNNQNNQNNNRNNNNQNQNNNRNNNNQNQNSNLRLTLRERRQQAEEQRLNAIRERVRQLSEEDDRRAEREQRRRDDLNLRIRQQNIDAALRVREQNLRYGNQNVNDVSESDETDEGRRRASDIL